MLRNFRRGASSGSSVGEPGDSVPFKDVTPAVGGAPLRRSYSDKQPKDDHHSGSKENRLEEEEDEEEGETVSYSPILVAPATGSHLSARYVFSISIVCSVSFASTPISCDLLFFYPRVRFLFQNSLLANAGRGFGKRIPITSRGLYGSLLL